ncbi:hypothetical protein [Acetivibrio straminisolvens]|jgi:hypothetical protein|uniref:Uncharacterized protein n=1 Tax=Acetivibrio straminisolvens JCM 21531 TaxID=1294263 RepID=W4V8S1_9FIRM|nr:hypothetical protein [Acetivibrio straminisolvens]GAE89790.1 hypothetical protein JCM21531_3352 [Acetivibrio straminisolvens JCM 21531]
MNDDIKRKNRFIDLLNMTASRKGISILLAVVLIAGMAGVFTGCVNDSSKVKSKDSVTFDGVDYILHENVGLDFSGFKDFHEGLGVLCEKIGRLSDADVYKINGLNQNEWIFLDNNSMLSPDAPYGGVYRSSSVKMDTIADFKPNHLDIYYLTPPTLEQSGTDIHVFDTGDSGIIEKIVAAIENGKAVSDEKQEEAANAMLKGNGRYKNYRLEFSSESYPKLLFRLQYSEGENGRFYIGYNGNITSYKVIEIDDTLHEYLP